MGKLRTGVYLALSMRRLDLRTALGKRVRKLRLSLVNDLGGDQAVTTGQRILIDRVACKVAMIHFQEQAILRGESREYKNYLALCNSLRGDLLALGLQRREREVLTLTQYLDQDSDEHHRSDTRS